MAGLIIAYPQLRFRLTPCSSALAQAETQPRQTRHLPPGAVPSRLIEGALAQLLNPKAWLVSICS
ncbi:hypothetical protein [Zobellella aerophila]|uniref:Uncharacterized protein n=1 Tax=Zobellella aerophila TaxID=870480 RepID=A0ABP6W6E5_9GAMM